MNHVIELVLALFAMGLASAVLLAVLVWDWHDGAGPRTPSSSPRREDLPR